MLTKELIDFVRVELSKGVTKEVLMQTLMSQGWLALDVQQAFTAVESPVIPTPPDAVIPLTVAPVVAVEKQSSGKNIGIVVAILLFCVVIAGLIFLYGPEKIMGVFSAKTLPEQNRDTVSDLQEQVEVEKTEIEKVDVVVATTTNDVAATSSPVSTDTEKEDVIRAILKSQGIFASNDIKQIRSYLSVMATTSKQKQELAETSDKDLLFGVSLISAFQGDVTESALRDPSTLFTKKSEGVMEVVLYKKDTKAKITMTSTKINGAWY